MNDPTASSRTALSPRPPHPGGEEDDIRAVGALLVCAIVGAVLWALAGWKVLDLLGVI